METVPTPRSAVLITRGHTVLLIERRRSRRSVYYVLPGGGLEAGETPEQAAVRELKEELGVDIEVLDKRLDPSPARRQTWIVRGVLRGLAEPKWLEQHKQAPGNTYRVVWLPFEKLGEVSVFPQGVVKLLVDR